MLGMWMQNNRYWGKLKVLDFQNIASVEAIASVDIVYSSWTQAAKR